MSKTHQTKSRNGPPQEWAFPAIDILKSLSEFLQADRGLNKHPLVNVVWLILNGFYKDTIFLFGKDRSVASQHREDRGVCYPTRRF